MFTYFVELLTLRVKKSHSWIEMKLNWNSLEVKSKRGKGDESGCLIVSYESRNIRSGCEIRPKFTTRRSKSRNVSIARHWFIPGTRAKVVRAKRNCDGSRSSRWFMGDECTCRRRTSRRWTWDKRGVVPLWSFAGQFNFYLVTPPQIHNYDFPTYNCRCSVFHSKILFFFLTFLILFKRLTGRTKQWSLLLMF